ncbi:ATP-binding protein [Chitinimonas naiadis]
MRALSKLLSQIGTLALQQGECGEHGVFEAYTLPEQPARCPHCHMRQSRAQDALQAQARRMACLMDVSHIPARYVGAGFKTFLPHTPAQREVVARFRRYLAGFGRAVEQGAGLIVTGGLGTGKTHLVCALANNIIHQYGRSVRYCTSQDMLAEIKAAYGAENKSEASEIERFASYDLLILDEADVHRSTETDLLLIFAVVNRRYNALKPTVLVSNQSVAKLKDYIGPRAVDRVLEHGEVIACDWASYRTRAAA